MANVPHATNRPRMVARDEIPDGNRRKTARQRRARDDGTAPPGAEEQDAPEVQAPASAEAVSPVGSGASPAETEEGPSSVMLVLAGGAAVIGWAAVSAGGGMRMVARDAGLSLPDDEGGARGSRPGERPIERPIERSIERPMQKALEATPGEKTVPEKPSRDEMAATPGRATENALDRAPVEAPDLPATALVPAAGPEGPGSPIDPSFDEDGAKVVPAPQWIDQGSPGDGRRLAFHGADAMRSDPELRRGGVYAARLVRRDVHGNEGDVHRVPIEAAGTLALRLRNDTGNTPQQKIDRITSDATVEVVGVDELEGTLEYRIDAGPWLPLGAGKVIGDAQFNVDGRHRVDLRSLDADKHPSQPVSLEFEVDRTAPSLLPLRVVHHRGDVDESGARLGVAGSSNPLGYVLTNQAKVELPGLEEGSVWYANRYDRNLRIEMGLDEHGEPVPREPVMGDSRMLPGALFKEGPQIIGVSLRDSAGNMDKVIGTERVFLDTTPPPRPAWTSFGSDAKGMQSFVLKEPESGAHFEHRSGPGSAWTRLGSPEGSLAGPLELRQVDLAGNASVGSLLATHQTLILSASSLVL